LQAEVDELEHCRQEQVRNPFELSRVGQHFHNRNKLA
jgi:hypothetical protein